MVVLLGGTMFCYGYFIFTVVIEYDLDVIHSVDYVIDMGPGGGDAGGEIVAEGTPEEIRSSNRSITGTFL